MHKTITLHWYLISLGTPLALFGVLVFLMRSSFLPGNELMNFAITADLVFTVPLVYILLIRKTRIPNTTVVPVMIAGLVIGTYFLPDESQDYLNIFRTWGLPLIELAVVTFVIIKVHSAIKKYKSISSSVPDFYSAVKSTCLELFPGKLAMPFATEVAVVYYGFIQWRSKEIKENEFTYHKKSGTPALLGAVILIIGIETPVLHLLLARWSVMAAWIISGISIYTAIQVLGFLKSFFIRPILVGENSVFFRYGILNEAEVPFSDIENIELTQKIPDEAGLVRKLSPLGDLESHNVIIKLRREHELAGIYGIKKTFKILCLHVDEPHAFQERMHDALSR